MFLRKFTICLRYLQLVESVAACLMNIGERVCRNSDMLDELCKHGIIEQVAHLIDSNGRTSISQPVYLVSPHF